MAAAVTGGNLIHRLSILHSSFILNTFSSGPFVLPSLPFPNHASDVTDFTTAGNMAAAPSRPFDYLEGLPGTVFQKLYQQPSTALAIFRRMLPDLGM